MVSKKCQADLEVEADVDIIITEEMASSEVEEDVVVVDEVDREDLVVAVEEMENIVDEADVAVALVAMVHHALEIQPTNLMRFGDSRQACLLLSDSSA